MVVETTDENVTASLEQDEPGARAVSPGRRSVCAGGRPGIRRLISRRIEPISPSASRRWVTPWLPTRPSWPRTKEETIAQNDAYNRADAEAASLAADLSDDPVRMVADVSDAANADARNAYATACSQAASADAFLRDYLGTTSK